MKYLLFALLLTVLPLAAAPPPVSVGGAVSLPSIGMRFRTFRDMKPMPLPLPAVLGEKEGAKLFSNYEVWRFRQSSGIWTSDDTLIQIGRVEIAAFDDQERKTEAELDTEFTVLEKPLEGEELRKWIGLFTLCKVTKDYPFNEALFGCKAHVFELEERGGAHQIAYILTPANDPDRQLLLHFMVMKQRYDDRAARAIRQILGSIQLTAPKDTGARRLTPAGLKQRKPGTPEYEASREKAIDSIKNFRDWWYEETENYIFISNQDDRRAMVRLRTDIERARKIFADYFPLEIPLKSVSVVRIFNTREGYEEYAGADMKWSGGFWSPLRRELVISPLQRTIPEAKQKEIMRQVAFHEGFHQYLFFASGEVRPAMWFNEGCAQYFEGIEFSGARGMVTLPAHSERALTSLFTGGKIHDLDALSKMDRNVFYGDNRDVNYNLAQALIYYLLKGTALDGNSKYSGIPLKYYEALIKTGDAEKSTEICFEGVDLKQLSRDLTKFWNDERLVKRSIRHQPPPVTLSK